MDGLKTRVPSPTHGNRLFCGWNSFVGIPKDIIGIHRNDLQIIGIKKIQEIQLLAMGGLKTRVPSPTHGNRLFAAGILSYEFRKISLEFIGMTY